LLPGNLLRHEYRHVDPEVLWSIVTGQLEELDNAAAALLENLDEARARGFLTTEPPAVRPSWTEASVLRLRR
jgi:hypothetical protein